MDDTVLDISPDLSLSVVSLFGLTRMIHESSTARAGTRL
jgi:hypothetical protein